MNFPLPGKADYVKLHSQIFYNLGPAAADLFACMGQELKDANDEADMWRHRAEGLQRTHPDFISGTEQNKIYQDRLKDRYNAGKNGNE